MGLSQQKFEYQKSQDAKAEKEAKKKLEQDHLNEAVKNYTPDKYVTNLINRMGKYFISASPEQKQAALLSVDKNSKLSEVEKEYILQHFGV